MVLLRRRRRQRQRKETWEAPWASTGEVHTRQVVRRVLYDVLLRPVARDRAASSDISARYVRQGGYVQPAATKSQVQMADMARMG